MLVQDNWLDLAAPEIQSRIARYSANEIRFNLLAVIGDRRQALGKLLRAAEVKRQVIKDKLSGSGATAAMATDDAVGSSADWQQVELPSSEEALRQLLGEIESQIVRWVAHPGVVMSVVLPDLFEVSVLL